MSANAFSGDYLFVGVISVTLEPGLFLGLSVVLFGSSFILCFSKGIVSFKLLVFIINDTGLLEPCFELCDLGVDDTLLFLLLQAGEIKGIASSFGCIACARRGRGRGVVTVAVVKRGGVFEDFLGLLLLAGEQVFFRLSCSDVGQLK